MIDHTNDSGTLTVPYIYKPFCIHNDKEARMTWVISTGLQDTGPACGACLATLWNSLSKFPDAISTVTIYPLDK